MPNLSRGPLRVTSLNVNELNSVLQRIQDQLDELSGLRGVHKINDKTIFTAIRVEDSNGNLIHSFGDSG